MFKDWRKGWKDFFTYRNKEQQAYFDARLAGKAPDRPWAVIKDDIDQRYVAMVAKEDEFLAKIDKRVASFLPDNEVRAYYLAWRNKARELRALDKAEVAQLYERIAGLSPRAREAEFTKFWQERLVSYEEMRQTDRIGNAAIAGDARAQQALAADVAQKAPPPTAQAVPKAAQEAVYRGTKPGAIGMDTYGGGGVHWTPEEDIAKGFGDVEKKYISPQAKRLRLSDSSGLLKSGEEELSRIVGEKVNLQNLYDNGFPPGYIQKIKDEGYDLIEFSNIEGREYYILNDEVLQEAAKVAPAEVTQAVPEAAQVLTKKDLSPKPGKAYRWMPQSELEKLQGNEHVAELLKDCAEALCQVPV
jgi:hypothetical protein